MVALSLVVRHVADMAGVGERRARAKNGHTADPCKVSGRHYHQETVPSMNREGKYIGVG
jgi:hypothetical protein